MAEKSNDGRYQLPSAPPSFDNNDANAFAQRPPPPSYEESLRMTNMSAATSSVPQQQYQHITPAQYYSGQMPSGSNLYQQYTPAQHYTGPAMPALHYQQQQQYYYQTAPGVVAAAVSNSKAPQVLEFAKGATIRTNASGSVIVPPPPPGCAPTAAQLAAMHGQPVVVKKTKKSFF